MAIETHEELLESYEQFFTNFKDDNGDYKYINQINRMIRDGKRSIVIDYNDLVLIDDMRDLDLASTLMENPYFMLSAGSEAMALHVKSDNLEFYKEVLLDRDHFYVRFLETPSYINIRDIRANHVDTLKWLDGIVIRTTEIKSIITKAFYTCVEGHELEIIFSDGVYFKPDRCMNDTCKAKEFSLDQRKSKLIDWQFVTIQEKPEDLPPGASPKSISCRLTDDIVNAVRPGDRVQFGGIVRTKASKQIKKGQVLTFDTWIDINYIESLTKDDDFLNITPDEEKFFIDISNDPKIHDRIINSIAPSIFGHTEVKEASMLLLFGGVAKTYPDGFSTRGQPNVLLIGDPGVAKSQLLRYVHSIAPRGIFTSGKGSSAAGLTAAIVRDPDTGEITLEAGALVLADRGICLIDEFDKMNENDRSAIHEAMEQHSYHKTTRLKLASGKEIKMGKFIDELFNKFPERSQEGIECEILDLSGLDYKITTTSFNEDFFIKINRVSRHKAPKYFFRVTFDHGRSIIVTPNHPMFVADANLIDTISAEKLQINSFVPAPQKVKFNADIKLQNEFTKIGDGIILPNTIDINLLNFMGYFVSNGFTVNSNSIGIDITNMNSSCVNDIKYSINQLFTINTIEHNNSLMINSDVIFKFFEINFPDLMKNSTDKTFPWQIFSLSERMRLKFISILSTEKISITEDQIYFSTISEVFANDISDLLLSVGIFTKIVKHQNTRNYKIYVHDSCMEKFIHKIEINRIKSYPKLKLSRENSFSSGKIILPPIVAVLIMKLLDRLDIPYEENFQNYINNDKGIELIIVNSYINLIEEKIETLLSKDLGSVRRIFHTSQYSQKIKVESRVNTSTIGAEILEIKDEIMKIKKYYRFRWLKIKNIEKIENKGILQSDWAYDITVIPTKNFIANGLILHNSVSIAKAGIVATLNARTGVFAAANPKYGRYEINRTFSENVSLSAPILSRFDLIFILRDEPEEENDSVIANHILNLHRFHGNTATNKPPLTEDQLKKYIAYAKKNYHPILTEEAAELIETFYVSMRSNYGKVGDATRSGDRVTITARQLEGIIRLSEARAKAALRSVVTKIDAQKAIDLVKFSLSMIAVDPETGAMDIDALYSGNTGTKRNKLNILMGLIDFLQKQNNGPFREGDLIYEAGKEGISEDYVVGMITTLKRDGDLYQPKPGLLHRS